VAAVGVAHTSGRLSLDPLVFDLRASVVPFAARVLHYGPSRTYAPSPWPLPVGRPELWFEDDVEGFQSVVRQGVLYAFCHQARGWLMRPVLVGGEAWSSELRCGRLWEVPLRGPLRFTEAAAELALGLYNMTARRPKEVASVGPLLSEHAPSLEVERLLGLELGASGDSALLYWLASGLWKELDPAVSGERVKGAGRVYEELLRGLTRRHALLELRSGPFNDAEGSPGDIRGALEGPLRAWLPWWVSHALWGWRERQGALWKAEPGRFTAVRRRQSGLLRAWIGAAVSLGWLDVLAPIAEHLAEELSGLRAAARSRGEREEELSAVAVGWVDRSFKDRRHVERSELRLAWGEIFGVGALLQAAHDQAARKHPVDRDAHEAWWLAWWEESGASALMVELEAVSRGIEGRLG
jgi:hypothetical protein